jgi:hypothetical protein
MTSRQTGEGRLLEPHTEVRRVRRRHLPRFQQGLTPGPPVTGAALPGAGAGMRHNSIPALTPRDAPKQHRLA